MKPIDTDNSIDYDTWLAYDGECDGECDPSSEPCTCEERRRDAREWAREEWYECWPGMTDEKRADRGTI